MRLRLPRRGRVTRKDRRLAAEIAAELTRDGTPEQAATLAGWLDHVAQGLPDDPRNADLRLLVDAMYEAWAVRTVREDPELIIVAEELNLAADRLKQYWSELRDEQDTVWPAGEGGWSR